LFIRIDIIGHLFEELVLFKLAFLFKKKVKFIQSKKFHTRRRKNGQKISFLIRSDSCFVFPIQLFLKPGRATLEEIFFCPPAKR